MKNRPINILIWLTCIGLFTGCANLRKSEGLRPNQNIEKNRAVLFEYSDKAGRFLLERESGRKADAPRYMVKEKMYPPDDEDKIVEKLVSISAIGAMKGLKLLRPVRSQYSVWFDGQKYFTELKVDVDNRKMLVEMSSPEKEWNGSEEYTFPKGTGVYCFFSQLIECASITGFINKAIEAKVGKMQFHIVWDGYPYIMEQYPGIEKSVFTAAALEYDGQTDENKDRFSLRFAGETVFYIVDPKSGQFEKKLWVSQGLTQTLKGHL